MAFINTRDFSVGQPAPTLAADSPIILQILTHSYNTAQFAKTRLNFVALMNNNSSVTITPKFGYSKKFTAADFPNKPEYYLSRTLKDQNGTTITGNTLSNIANSFAQSVQSDVVLNQNYYVSYSGTSVTLTSRQASKRFELNTGDIIVKNELGNNVTTGITVTVQNTGNDLYEGSLIADYSIYVETYVDTSINSQYGQTLDKTNFNRITEIQLPFSLDNDHRFNLSSIAKTFVFTTKPDFDATNYTQEIDYMHPFFFRYGENYPLIQNTPTKRKREKGVTDFKWVLNASLDFNTANNLSDYVSSTGRKFLTNSPTSKKATKAGNELLYFVLEKDINTTCKVYGDITFWDGSKLNNQILLDLFTDLSGNFGGCWVIPAGFTQLGLDTIETSSGKKIKTVQLSLKTVSGTINLSEKKTYRYDFNQPINRFGIAFLNSMGTFDSFDFQGLKTEDINRETSSYTVPLVYNPNGSVVEGSKITANYDTKITKKITVNSGFITQTEFDWLMELMKSNVIYSYDGIDNYLKLDSFKYQKNNQSSEYNIECTFIESLYLNNVSV